MLPQYNEVHKTSPSILTYCTENSQSFICFLSQPRADYMIQKHCHRRKNDTLYCTI